MPVSERLPAWLDAKTATAAGVTALILFAVSYAADAVLYFLNIPAAATIINNVVIAILGATVVLIFLRARHDREVMERARERTIIIAEMNHHIRNAMTPLVVGVSSDDLSERLRTLDQATDRVDHVLTKRRALRSRAAGSSCSAVRAAMAATALSLAGCSASAAIASSLDCLAAATP